ncbi:MAG: DUF6056 family protein, partial [Bacteroidales bacterium]|nr:DUF6056 family protein [Bacteroidales bacterium]
MRKGKRNINNQRNNLPEYGIFLYLIPILLLTFFLFGKIQKQEFLNWDDPDMITNNSQIRSLSPDNIKDIFTPDKDKGEYQPLTTLSYAINYYFSDFEPFSYKLVNLCLHLFNVILIFYMILLLFKNKLLSTFVSLMFSFHPMQVEVVAWASARNYLLFSFFFLLSLIFYIKYLQSNYKSSFLWFAISFFLLALLSKSTAVVLPLLLFSLDYFFKRKFESKTFIEKIPFLLLALFFGLIALLPKTANQYQSMSDYYNYLDRIFFIFHSISFYIFKLLVPIHQKVIYLYPDKIDNFLPFIYYLSPILILFLIVVFLKFIKSEKRTFYFAALFFLINIILVIHLIPTDRTGITAERYVYLSGIGFFVILYKFIEFVSKKYSIKHSLISFALIVYSGFLIFTTNSRISVWENNVTLWTSEIEINPLNETAYINLGDVYYRQRDFNKAIEVYEKALDINPTYELAYNNLGLAKFELGFIEDAICDYNKALELNSDFGLAFY